MEQHAGLQGGERVDVLDVAPVPDDPVHGRLVEAGQGEVRRAAPASVRLGAVGDDLAEDPEQLAGQRGDGVLPVQVLPDNCTFSISA